MAAERLTKEADVKAASDRFYDALERMANGDAGPMAEACSHADDVTTMHPIGGREVGWSEVGASWQGVADMASDGRVTRKDQLIRVEGDLAFELCTEDASMKLGGEPVAFEGRATNVYRLEGGEWKLLHHHVDANPEFIAVLEDLQKGS